MLVEAQERAESDGKPTSNNPPMNIWSPEIEALASIEDRIEALIYVTRAANGDKTAKPPKPRPRPRTLIERIKGRHRQARHNALADRLLGR